MTHDCFSNHQSLGRMGCGCQSHPHSNHHWRPTLWWEIAVLSHEEWVLGSLDSEDTWSAAGKLVTRQSGGKWSGWQITNMFVYSVKAQQSLPAPCRGGFYNHSIQWHTLSMPASSQACPISCLNIDIVTGMEDMYGLDDMNSPCQHLTGYCYYFKPNLQMLWPIMESSTCHHAPGSHQVTWRQNDYVAPFHFDEDRGSISLECKHTLETFLAHTALASETICGCPNVLFTNGILRVFAAPDQGYQLAAKEIHR